MNYKALLKALNYMFLPTLGVLLILLVGFFDPIEMWTFIKSNSGGTIFTKVMILISEITLVTSLYFKNVKEEQNTALRKAVKKVQDDPELKEWGERYTCDEEGHRKLNELIK